MPIPHVPGEISHKFGEDRRTRRHNGIDYPVGKGTPVKASLGGVVVRSTEHLPREIIVIEKKGKNKGKMVKKFTGSYGNVIILYHGHDVKKLKHTYTLYAHLDKTVVSLGMKVREGAIVGSSGRSGTSQGFYNRKGGFELHFEVIKSSRELTWVKTGNLDLHFAKEDKRIDPEVFLRRASEDFTMNRKAQYTVKLSDGTTITFDGFKYLRFEKNGRLLKVVKKGERPSAKIVEGVQMAIDFLTANYDLSGLHLNPGSFPLAAEELISEEEVKAWHKKTR